MSDPLWSKNGARPVPLPFKDTLPDGTILTNLAGEPASRAELGWTEGPEPPDFDPASQALDWVDGAWAVISTIPSAISMLQLELELLDRGLTDDVETAITALGPEAAVRWKRTLTVHRHHPMVLAVQANRSWSDALLDEIAAAAAVRA